MADAEKPRADGYDGTDDDLLAEAKEAFEEAAEAEKDNRDAALDDLRFALLDEQWPEEIAQHRRSAGKPMLTSNVLKPTIRQVVNDGRQNRPAHKVRPVDSGADIETANVFGGIIRSIEANSRADIAFDTASECAVSMGVGYWRVTMDYARDDTFDLDLAVEPIPDPFTVYGDPNATSFDGSDWMSAFVLEAMPKKVFERRFKDAEAVDFEGSEWQAARKSGWLTDDTVTVAEWWKRDEVMRTILQLSDGSVVDEERLKDPKFRTDMALKGLGVRDNVRPRRVPSYRVRSCLLTGAEILDEKDWPGRWIPIIPVYGEVVNEQGKRHFRSLIRSAKDAQKMRNIWRSIAAEVGGLMPKAPYIGPEDAFTGTDAAKWGRANIENYPYIAYKGQVAPARQQLDFSAAGAIQEAMIADADIKAITGIHEAGLGAPSNETSGRAIIARQREGDTSTFHFLDNLTRAMRHSGAILLDLIPHVWPDERVIRLMGEDGTVTEQKINGPVPVMDPQTQQPVMEADPLTGQQRPKMRTFSLTAGKYDVTTSAGPNYTTRREEAAEQMVAFVQAFPASAPYIGDLIAKNLDWPGAEEIAKRLKAMLPSGLQDAVPPELKAQIEAGVKLIEELRAENEKLKAEHDIEVGKLKLEEREIGIKEYEAETKRMEAVAKLGIPFQPMPVRAAPPGPAPMPRPPMGAPPVRPNGAGPIRPQI